jgi:hypothetical protein
MKCHVNDSNESNPNRLMYNHNARNLRSLVLPDRLAV